MLSQQMQAALVAVYGSQHLQRHRHPSCWTPCAFVDHVGTDATPKQDGGSSLKYADLDVCEADVDNRGYDVTDLPDWSSIQSCWNEKKRLPEAHIYSR